MQQVRIKGFNTIDNEPANKTQMRIQQSFNQLIGCPLLHGVIAQQFYDNKWNEVIYLNPGVDNLIPTGIDAEIKYWHIMDKDTNCDIWRKSLPEGYDNKQFINLWSDDVCLIKLYLMT